MHCPYCGVTNPDTASTCHFCGQRFPLGFNWRRIRIVAAITVIVPLIVYLLMTRVMLRLL